MSTDIHLRPAVLAVREQLAQGREGLRRDHEAGASGSDVCTGLTDLYDAAVMRLYQDAVVALGAAVETEVALVAHGGYGRREVAPFSDVDLMLLFRPAAALRAAELARQLSRDICDAQLKLGFSLRTTHDACGLARQDATVFSSLAESRLLAGNTRMFQNFTTRLRRGTRRRWRALAKAIIESRYAERHQYGETVYLLEPNVKRSLGCLRDIQLVRWLGFARHGIAELEGLRQQRALTDVDHHRLTRASEYLLRLRNDLHFHAGKCQDLLTRHEQIRLTALYRYEGRSGILPAERFMRDFFERTGDVRYISSHFVAGMQARSGLTALLAPLFSRSVDGDFRIGPVHISATRRGLAAVCGDLAEVLRLMELASSRDRRIDHATWEAIRDAMARRPRDDLSLDATQRFLSLLSEPGHLADLLRRLHQLRALEQIVPALQHARCLVQFTDYHKYTVDEHTIRSVECATEFQTDPRPIGDAYRTLRDKRLLHLALLLHDLGKGYSDDHCTVGALIAVGTAKRLDLSEHETDVLKFLVSKHLFMQHTAFRQDLGDESVAVRLAVDVGSPEILQMLFVMSCADLAAVGPGVLNDWKLDLLTELYFRTRRHLTGDDRPGTLEQEHHHRRQALRELVEVPKRDAWWERQIDALPTSYLAHVPGDRMLDALRRLRDLPPCGAAAWAHYAPELKVSVYWVGAHESLRPGAFHQLAGTLTANGLQILSAETHSLADGLVLDRFHVEDADYAGQPPAERLNEVCRALVGSLTVDALKTPSFRRLWTTRAGTRAAGLELLPTRVLFDDATSDRFTIITIFAYDRRGLLYAIGHSLFELGVVVHLAKIATYLDQVVDVFYVTDSRGRKLHDEQRQAEIRRRLTERISAVEP
ncbi:MAG: HD domain-containing protein [Planctomycetes bacterium]|nr:HD domain-containing protein [Planctomycetota bacterium]